MKKLFVSLMVVASTTFAVSNVNASSNVAIATEQGEKTAVKAAELPEAVKATLASNAYEGWSVSSAALENGTYTIELKKGEETKTVKLDKDGKLVE